MCGRYATTADPATLATELDAIDEVGEVASRSDFNVAPTTQVLTVVDRHDERRVRRMRWGLVPSWSREVGGPVLFNARADSVDKPAFRNAFTHTRCLVPMDGWYEWQNETMSGQGRAPGRTKKIPYYLSPEDGSRLYMAGLWSVWNAPAVHNPSPVLSCAIVTVDSVAQLTEVHDRMPLVLPRDRWDAWLDPRRPASADLLTVSPEAIADIAIRRVSTRVNRVENNGPELLEQDPGTLGEAQAGEQLSLL
ncbi:SOS response-associated peptidase [Rhodococcus tibetensis]|uniref:Abasic site processing protein n=1 Tax=Rhodococcus tibetensis TaxID=2965064 RepID=A0ABT1QGM7_9NOCA|nr:SOS response-associated peptidase [Rhodococcus sp. FXJ9.536]MCQ4121431.1 SOS response-associated peptidase [Rhodococcus sp. FXJ9.536]